MNTATSQKIISGVFPLSIAGNAIKYVVLFLFGAIAITMHARLRLHLGIPGHHGFMYMAFMVSTSMIFSTRLAGMAFSLGSVAMLYSGWLNFSNPFIGIEYALMGMVCDVLLRFAKSKNNKIIFIALIGAVGYGMIPLTRFILTGLTGYPYGAFLKHGYVFPFITHIAFGTAGALLGLGIFSLSKKLKNK